MNPGLQEQIKIMEEGGQKLVSILKVLKEETKIGKRASELNELAEKLIAEAGAEPAFKNYHASFCKNSYPYSLCVSINNVVVHGLAKKDIIIKNEDVVSLDLGIKFKNYFTDAAITVGVGNISKENKKLILAAKKALEKGIRAAAADNAFGDIGWAIESTILDYGFKPIKDLCGHDIGKFIHGDLQVLNFGDPGTGQKIKPGMIFTIEPMASISSEFTIQDSEDECFFVTKDNSVSAHFEATLAILENETIVLTPVLDIT